MLLSKKAKNTAADAAMTEETEQTEENTAGEKVKIGDCTPVWCRVFYCMAGVSAVMLVLFYLNEKFSDFYNRYIGSAFRIVLSKITGWIPFSLAETLLMMLPVILVCLLILVFKTYKKTFEELLRLLMIMLAVLSYFFSSFVLAFCAGYHGTPIEEKLGLDREKVSPEELACTAKWLSDEMNALVPEICFTADSFSDMPFTFGEMNGKLMEAYKTACKKYDFIPDFTSRAKKIILSEPMTYTHVSGVYSYFTGESNINVNFPDYILPFTAAHELAHQRGVAREDEANFVAFLVCIESDEPYIKYSAYLNVYEYVMNSLYSADKELYKQVIAGADLTIRYEMAAYNEFFAKYEKNVAAAVAGKVNDTYLKTQGQKAGEKSYDLVTDLAVAWYKKEINR